MSDMQWLGRFITCIRWLDENATPVYCQYNKIGLNIGGREKGFDDISDFVCFVEGMMEASSTETKG